LDLDCKTGLASPQSRQIGEISALPHIGKGELALHLLYNDIY
jgi:hypothetical protein